MILVMQIMNYLVEQGHSVKDIESYFEDLTKVGDPIVILEDDLLIDLKENQKRRIMSVLNSGTWRSALKLIEIDQEEK